MTAVIYRATPPAETFPSHVKQVARQHPGATVCDLGGGANPLLSEKCVSTYGLRYALIDASAEELGWAPISYEKVVADLTSHSPSEMTGECDIAVSRYLLEHISEPATFHKNVHSLLKEGGRAIHFFSTLYALPFVANRLLPHPVAKRLAALTLPGRETEGREPVFPASYRWCRGPTTRQIRRFQSVGFHVEEYVGYFGHTYFRRIPILQRIEYRGARVLVRQPVPALTSFARVTLVKWP